MKYKVIAFLIGWVLMPSVICAQKYLSTDSKEITKNWNGNQFSSEKTLQENLKDISEVSFMNKVLQKNSIQKIFEENEMLTVFVMMDSSFSELDKEEKDALLRDNNEIESMMTRLSIPGRVDKNSLLQAVKKQGTANLATLNGRNIQITQKDGELFLTDDYGNKAKFEYFDFYHKKGLFHLINGMVFLKEK